MWLSYIRHDFMDDPYQNANLQKSSSLIIDVVALSQFFVLVLAMSFFSSCFEENFISDANIPIEASVDTLRFDTVFTTVGSATRIVKLFNQSDENINISSIGLAKGSQSMFRLNVDGTPGNQIEEVPILARDSLYIFVEVTVDPDQPVSISPFVISEDLIIASGESQTLVKLEAWGQNANYFPSRNAQGQLIRLSCNNQDIVWDDPKPYVIYGLLFVDSCNVVIPEGTQVYVHGGLGRVDETIFSDGGLVFLSSSTLRSEGSASRPVVFQGDRLEPRFSDRPGQWAGLRFLSESSGDLRHTEIRNSIVGIRADSASVLTMDAVTIANTSNVGLIGINSTIFMDNGLIYGNGPQSVALIFGGDYQFRYTTIANFENQSPALYMDNFSCVDPECSTVLVNALNATFVNSIIMGSNDDEIDVIDATEGSEPDFFSVSFDHTLIKVEDVIAELPENYCLSCLQHVNEPVFIDDLNDDYRLDTMSLARMQGVPIIDLSIDQTGMLRDAMNPDLGCFEFID